MKRYIRIIACGLLALGLGWTVTAEEATVAKEKDTPVPKAEAKDGKETAEAEDVTITAERMEMHPKDRYTELTGNVLVQDSAVNLTAEKIRVYTDEHNKLEKVEAEDHVAIRKLDGSESATGDKGLYVIKEDTIILDGNCTLMQGNNILQCKRIIYDRKKQTISAEGGTLILPNLRRKDVPLVPEQGDKGGKKQSEESTTKEEKDSKSKSHGFLPFLDKQQGDK